MDSCQPHTRRGDCMGMPAMQTDWTVDLLDALPDDGQRRPTTWTGALPPSLTIEILSPSTARLDRVRKREFYRRIGVPEYWIVDLHARAIERWLPTDPRPEIVADGSLT